MWLVGLTDFCCGPHSTPEMVEASQKNSDFGSAVNQLGGFSGTGLPGVFQTRHSGFVLVHGSGWERLQPVWMGDGLLESISYPVLFWHGAHML